MRHRHAFTLIEMMIALALGLLLIYSAAAGFRAASQSVTVANRLALENAMLRAGYFQAQEQLDFWTNVDDPADGSNQLLRQADSGGRTMCFAPMYQALPGGSTRRFDGSEVVAGDPQTWGAVKPRPASTYADTAWEADRGWDPSYSWAPCDPRTWFRGNLAEKIWTRTDQQQSPLIFGRYALFSNAQASPSLASLTFKVDPNDGASALGSSSYSATVAHRWYPNTVKSLLGVLGYSAFTEYLPPNAIYTWYDNADGNASTGGIEKICIDPGGAFCNGDGGQITSRGIYRQTYSTSYGYMDPRYIFQGALPTTDRLVSWFYKHYDTDYTAANVNHTNDANGNATVVDIYSQAGQLQELNRRIGFPAPLLVVRPSAWPQVTVSVSRLVKNAHQVAVARVDRVSPLTGELIEISFCGLGSSLRGARQQRGRNGGWAAWDDAPGTSGDPTLDSP